MADTLSLDVVSRVATELVLNGLWQGAAVAAVAGLLSRGLRGSSSATRYVLWSAALSALVVLPAATALSRATRPAPVASPVVASAPVGEFAGGAGVDESVTSNDAAAAPVVAATPAPSVAEPLVRLDADRWALWAFAALVVVWAVRLARVAAGALAIARMRRRCVAFEEERVARLDGWSRAVREGRRASIAASPDARTPMVLGIGRPIVAIPESLVDRLTDDELDQIALHELAHVRRRDDWAKLAQAVVEAVCWFHPAARWLARRADAAREIACDDWVIAVTRERKSYARCLLKLAGLGLTSASVPAPGAFGRKPMISERIELVMKTNRNAAPKPSTLSRVSLAAALFAAASLCLASGPAVALTSGIPVETPPAGGPRGAAPHSGPEPTAAAPRGDLKRSLVAETADAIARDDARGENPDVRRAAVAALAGRAGTVLAIDARTGRVLTAVNQEWAFRRTFTPASTIKLATAVAGLEAGAFDPAEKVAAQGDRVDFDAAIAKSNTEYFQQVGERAGADRFMSVVRAFGLGEPTGANYGGEVAGVVPAAGAALPAHAFGAGEGFEVTPAQLASMAAAIGNGGTLLAPYAARDGAAFEPIVRRRLGDEDAKVFGRLLPGMTGAVAYGTATKATTAGLAVAGKTGTADGPNGVGTGLFMSFAPVDAPRYAVVVVLRGKNVLGADASAVAGKVYKALQSTSR